MTPQEKVLDKLRKLLAHAESAKTLGNEAEAHAFMSKVREILVTHKLEMSDVELEEQLEDDPIDKEYVVAGGKEKKTRDSWAVKMAVAVAKAYFCDLLIVTGSNKLIFIGRGTDRQAAIYVTQRLIEFVNTEAKKEHAALRYKLWKERDGDMSAAHGFVASFKLGALQRIRTRLRELRQEDERKHARFAVVLASAEAANKQWLKDNMKVGKVNVNVKGGGNEYGRQRGEAAGDRANIRADGLGSGSTTRDASIERRSGRFLGK